MSNTQDMTREERWAYNMGLNDARGYLLDRAKEAGAGQKERCVSGLLAECSSQIGKMRQED